MDIDFPVEFSTFTIGNFNELVKKAEEGNEIDPETGLKIKNGTDRIVDGINMQSKYFSDGGRAIRDCFGKQDGMYKYKNPDESPMVIEVPKDDNIYKDAVEAMREKITEGKVAGVTDPDMAEKLVKKGHFTLAQVKNIAKAGTIESITFDAANGAIISTYTFGVSTAISFATSIWNGEDYAVALSSAVNSGLKIGGMTFVTAVISGQISKAGLNSALVGSSEAIVKSMSPKAQAALVNAFRSGKNIYGAAAMKSASKMLRGNVITAVASVVVLSSADIFNIFQRRISGAQLFKNVANLTSSVAGGTAGWFAGAAAGSAILPGVGTLIGAVVGSIAGGSTANKASNALLSEFIEDDANVMLKIIQNVFARLSEEFLLSKSEAEEIVDTLKDKLTGKFLKEMFASLDREVLAEKLLIKDFEEKVKSRKHIKMPSNSEMKKGLEKVLEDIVDCMEGEVAIV